MIAKFNLPEVMAMVKHKVEIVLPVVGAQAVTFVARRIRKNESIVTSNLINSITYSTVDKTGKFIGKTDGQELSPAAPYSVKVGTTVVYAPRVEFGFEDTDSKGRAFHQKAKPFLRPALEENSDALLKLFKRGLYES